jgi:hypothetical protein
MDNISLVEHKAVLSPKEYNALVAQLASRIANAYVARQDDRTAARDAVLLAVEIMERSGLQVAAPQPAVPAGAQPTG